MEAKEFKEQLGELEKNIQAKADEKIKAMQDKAAEDVKKLNEQLSEMEEKRAEMQRHLNEIEAKQKDARVTGGESFVDELRKALETGATQYKSGQRNVEISLKTAITSSNFTNDTTNNTRVIAEMREAGINKAPKRSPFVRTLAFNGTATSDTISWTEKVSESGVPITLAELDAFPEETSSYQQFSTSVKKIGGMTKVSEEKLSDVEWMLNEIQAELIQRHDLVVDTQLLSGTGLTTNLKGVKEYAQAFAAGDFALKVVNANRADVLRVAYNQIVIELFQPNAICLHPTDITFMELEKDPTTSQYVLPPFVSANGMNIKGLPVVENTGITAGTYLIGDFTRLGVFAKGGPVLEIGRDGSDFSTDQVTVKLRERIAARIKGRDVKAFVKGTFSTDIAAILKP